MQELTEFESNEAKVAHVNQQLQLSKDSIIAADKAFQSFTYREALDQYKKASNVLMGLLKLTKDDANFQAYLKK